MSDHHDGDPAQPRYRPGQSAEDYDRQTAIMDTIPHAATIGKIENWREAADEFERVLASKGYVVRPKKDDGRPVVVLSVLTRALRMLAGYNLDYSQPLYAELAAAGVELPHA